MPLSEEERNALADKYATGNYNVGQSDSSLAMPADPRLEDLADKYAFSGRVQGSNRTYESTDATEANWNPIRRGLPISEQEQIALAQAEAERRGVPFKPERTIGGDLKYQMGDQTIYENLPGPSMADASRVAVEAVPAVITALPGVGAPLGRAASAGLGLAARLGPTSAKVAGSTVAKRMAGSAVENMAEQAMLEGAAATSDQTDLSLGNIAAAGLMAPVAGEAFRGLGMAGTKLGGYASAQTRNAGRAILSSMGKEYDGYRAGLSSTDEVTKRATMEAMASDRTLPEATRKQLRIELDDPRTNDRIRVDPAFARNVAQVQMNLTQELANDTLDAQSKILARSKNDRAMKPFSETFETKDVVENLKAHMAALGNKMVPRELRDQMRESLGNAVEALRSARNAKYDMDLDAGMKMNLTPDEVASGSMHIQLPTDPDSDFGKFMRARMFKTGDISAPVHKVAADLAEEGIRIAKPKLSEAGAATLLKKMEDAGIDTSKIPLQRPAFTPSPAPNMSGYESAEQAQKIIDAQLKKDKAAYDKSVQAMPKVPADQNALFSALISARGDESPITAARAQRILSDFYGDAFNATNGGATARYFDSSPSDLLQFRGQRYYKREGAKAPIRDGILDALNAVGSKNPKTGAMEVPYSERDVFTNMLKAKSGLVDAIEETMRKRGVPEQNRIKAVHADVAERYGDLEELESSRLAMLAFGNDSSAQQLARKAMATPESAEAISKMLGKKPDGSVDPNGELANLGLLTAGIENRLDMIDTSVGVGIAGANEIKDAAKKLAADAKYNQALANIAKNAGKQGEEMYNNHLKVREMLNRLTYGKTNTAGLSADAGFSESDVTRGFTKALSPVSYSLLARVLTAPSNVNLTANGKIDYLRWKNEQDAKRKLKYMMRFAENAGFAIPSIARAEIIALAGDWRNQEE